MSDSEPPKFASIEDERDYWKEQSAEHQQRYLWAQADIVENILSHFTDLKVIWHI